MISIRLKKKCETSTEDLIKKEKGNKNEGEQVLPKNLYVFSAGFHGGGSTFSFCDRRAALL